MKETVWLNHYSSVGGATLEMVKAYVETQGTIEHKRKSEAKRTKATS